MKRLLFILSVILFTTLQSQGQARTASAPQDGVNPVIKFYPNPATTFITFDFQKGHDKGYDIQVYNFLGKVVYEQKNIAPKTTLNLSDYNRGVYIFRLIDREGKVVESGKFSVSK